MGKYFFDGTLNTTSAFTVTTSNTEYTVPFRFKMSADTTNTVYSADTNGIITLPTVAGEKGVSGTSIGSVVINGTYDGGAAKTNTYAIKANDDNKTELGTFQVTNGPKGDDGDDGIQGYGFVAAVSRTGFTEDDWNNTYGVTNHGEVWVNTTVPTGIRDGDLFVVIGASTDEGKGHMAVYKYDSKIEGSSLRGTCIGHTIIALKGNKGDKGDTGAKGDKGDTGAKGDKGDTGSVADLASGTTGSVVTSLSLGADKKITVNKGSVGGRNLLKENKWRNATKTSDSYLGNPVYSCTYPTSNAPSNGLFDITYSDDLNGKFANGEYVTVSFYAKSSTNITDSKGEKIAHHFYNTKQATTGGLTSRITSSWGYSNSNIIDGSAYNIPLTTTWKKYSITWKLDDQNAEKDNITISLILFRLREVTKGTTIYFSNVKLEKGSISTDWSENISDVIHKGNLSQENLFAKRYLLDWNNYDSGITTLGADEDGLYYDIAPLLLWRSNLVNQTTRSNLLPWVTFKENTQYTLKVKWSANVIESGSENNGLYLGFYYRTSGGSTGTTWSIIQRSNTEIKESTLISPVGTTILGVTTTFGASTVHGKIYDICLTEGNMEPEGYPVARVDLEYANRGGKNLLLHTEDPSPIFSNTSEGELYMGMKSMVITKPTSGLKSSTYYHGVAKLKNNGTYTLSFYAKADSSYIGNSDTCFYFTFYNSSHNTNTDHLTVYKETSWGYKTHNGTDPAITNIPLTTEWKKYWITYTLSSSVPGLNNNLLNIVTPSGSISSNFYFCGLKLEEGRVATDWTPNESDMSFWKPVLNVDVSDTTKYSENKWYPCVIEPCWDNYTNSTSSNIEYEHWIEISTNHYKTSTNPSWQGTNNTPSTLLASYYYYGWGHNNFVENGKVKIHRQYTYPNTNYDPIAVGMAPYSSDLIVYLRGGTNYFIRLDNDIRNINVYSAETVYYSTTVSGRDYREIVKPLDSEPKTQTIYPVAQTKLSTSTTWYNTYSWKDKFEAIKALDTQNINRETQSFYNLCNGSAEMKISNGGVGLSENGKWRKSFTGGFTGTFENVDITNDAPIQGLKQAIKIKATSASGSGGFCQDSGGYGNSNFIIKAGTVLTMSCYARSDYNGLQIFLQPYYNATEAQPSQHNYSLSTTWKKITYTCVPTNVDLSGLSLGYVYMNGNATNNGHYFEVCGVSVKYGELSSNWSPSEWDGKQNIITASPNRNLFVYRDAMPYSVSGLCQYNYDDYSFINKNYGEDHGTNTAKIKVQTSLINNNINNVYSNNWCSGGHFNTTFTITKPQNQLRIGINGTKQDILLVYNFAFEINKTYTVSFDVNDNCSAAIGQFVISHIKLEKGDRETQFIPATEDNQDIYIDTDYTSAFETGITFPVAASQYAYSAVTKEYLKTNTTYTVEFGPSKSVSNNVTGYTVALFHLETPQIEYWSRTLPVQNSKQAYVTFTTPTAQTRLLVYNGVAGSCRGNSLTINYIKVYKGSVINKINNLVLPGVLKFSHNGSLILDVSGNSIFSIAAADSAGDSTFSYANVGDFVLNDLQHPLALRGSGTNPKYNNNDIALAKDYVAKTGDTISGLTINTIIRPPVFSSASDVTSAPFNIGLAQNSIERTAFGRRSLQAYTSGATLSYNDYYINPLGKSLVVGNSASNNGMVLINSSTTSPGIGKKGGGYLDLLTGGDELNITDRTNTGGTLTETLFINHAKSSNGHAYNNYEWRKENGNSSYANHKMGKLTSTGGVEVTDGSAGVKISSSTIKYNSATGCLEIQA